MGEIAEKSQKLVQDFVERQRPGAMLTSSADPLNLAPAYAEFATRMFTNPVQVMQGQFDLWQGYMRLWQTTGKRMIGHETAPVAAPARDDRRFKDPAWNDNILFDFIKQSYLLSARYLVDTVERQDGLDAKTKHKLEFYTRQFVDAMAPSNFALTNPEVLKTTLETRGENLLRGLKNMLDDLERGKGKLAIKMTDFDAFELGRNIAMTPCKVVYQTELVQLLQYEPSTEQVHKTPLMIVPPWINKFYILDLQAKNSFIKWAVDQGFTVFVLSWINPDESYAQKSFEDYMTEGTLAALDAIEQATGERQVTAIGYCLGGTLTSVTTAYLRAKGDDRIKAITLFTTMLDFSDAGDLGVFIDEELLASLEDTMAQRGYLDGREMATTFNMLRANDLIWSFVVNNYLLGKDPFPFDLLYWNSDSTRMPAAMHSYYLRKCYQENKLVEPGGVELCGAPIDLRDIDIPAYWLSTREDHIAPWTATYAGTRLTSGPKTFVLAGSGHIAGVVNPPASNKYGYWLNDGLPPSPEAFVEGATHHEGSWWPHWSGWNASFSDGEMVPARVPGDGALPVVEEGPGNYVKVRAV
ncbi:MAG: class I poly(R)-hydroxyalkanoic acid synthase [Geminicoccaceae bacterium]|nr:MAG: class I poly(R)-hydroxyalkanoic acid synthase [Geminicoccaceae bacterium]